MIRQPLLCLIKLHRLPIEYRINFKISFLVFKRLHGTAHGYLADLIHRHKQTCNLRSVSGSYLTAKVAKFKTLDDCSFSVTATGVWNSLPFNIRQTTNQNLFKSPKDTIFKSELYIDLCSSRILLCIICKVCT